MAIYDKSTRELLNEWAKAHVQPGEIFTRSQPLEWFAKHYPETKANTVKAHLRAMSTNAPSRVHNLVSPGNGYDTFFQVGRDEFRLFEPETDPDPIYKAEDTTPSTASEETDSSQSEYDELASTKASEFALERHLQEFLIKNLGQVEAGLSPYFEDPKRCLEFQAGGRRIDILARDREGYAVVLELKVSKGYDRVIGQLLRYIGWVRRNLEEGELVRGIIVASEISEDLMLAVSELDGVSLYEYRLNFSVESVSLD